jgi:hypothetical protein
MNSTRLSPSFGRGPKACASRTANPTAGARLPEVDQPPCLGIRAAPGRRFRVWALRGYRDAIHSGGLHDERCYRRAYSRTLLTPLDGRTIFRRPNIVGMIRRRSIPDPLFTTDEPTWMVVHDRCSLPVEVTKLEPNADLHAILNAARDARIADGLTCDAIHRYASYFYCTKDGVRLQGQVRFPDPPFYCPRYAVGSGTPAASNPARRRRQESHRPHARPASSA